MLFQSGVYKLDIDTEKTAAYYAAAEGILCDCLGCQNYVKAVATLPDSVKVFFHQFGIDCAKPAEAAAVHSGDGGMTLYSGHFYLCGTIEEGKNPFIQVDEKLCRLDERYVLEIAKDCTVFFRDDCMKYKIDCPKPAIQAEFSFRLPWVLDEPNPYT